MAPPPTAIVFDLDDTLAVTAGSRQRLLDDATARVDAPALDRAAYLQAHGTVDATETRSPIFDHLLDGEHDDADADALARAYREAIEDALEPVPGAADLVRALRNEYCVGLLTDGPIVAQEGKIRELDWGDLFDAVVVTGRLPAGKPDRRTFAAICDRLDVHPAETVLVGDRPEVDIAGAADAGLQTVQVLTPENPDRHPAADAAIDREHLVAHLPGLLQDL
ncbi:MAG: HAD family hydrolase [Halorientalis sp.]